MDLPVAPEGLDILLHPGYQAVRAVERLVLRNNHYVVWAVSRICFVHFV